jgi:CheY-like chemotaxis protein
MNGYELARQIRGIAPCTLFALSGYGAHTAPADNVVSSFDQHLMKPLNTAALLQAIARLG